MRNNRSVGQSKIYFGIPKYINKYSRFIVWSLIIAFLLITVLFSNQLSGWLKGLKFIEVLDSLAKLGLVTAIATFLLEIPQRAEQVKIEAKKNRFEYWRAIDAAAVAKKDAKWDLFKSSALRMALEELSKDKDDLGNRIEMHGINVSNADLSGIDLSNADLEDSQFMYTDLSGAKLCGANLQGISFRQARLFNTDFSDADVTQADFRDALYDDRTLKSFGGKLNPKDFGAYYIEAGSDLQDADLNMGMLWEVNLENANLQGAKGPVRIERTNLTKAELQNSDLSGSRGHYAKFQEANLDHSNLSKSRFRHANFSKSSLCNVNLSEADLRGANLCEANLQYADLSKAQLNNSDVDGANFYKANIGGADFRGVKNISKEQIQNAEFWEMALYDEGFHEESHASLDKRTDQK